MAKPILQTQKTGRNTLNGAIEKYIVLISPALRMYQQGHQFLWLKTEFG